MLKDSDHFIDKIQYINIYIYCNVMYWEAIAVPSHRHHRYLNEATREPERTVSL